MGPITILFVLGLTNVILEKAILPTRRLMKQQVRRVNCGDLGYLGLKPEEFEELKRHPLVRLGTETERCAATNAAKTGESHVDG